MKMSLLYLLIIGFLLTTVEGFGQNTWVKTYGGYGNDLGYSIISTYDRNYVFTGVANSDDQDFNGLAKGNEDIFIIKIDTLGKIIWKKLYGGWLKDWGTRVIETKDSNIILIGNSYSNDGDFGGLNKGGSDITIIKLNKEGNIIWKNVVGGTEDETVRFITNTNDGGFVITGFSKSNDLDFEGLRIGNQDEKKDIFVIKYDFFGKVIWKKVYGGTNYDDGFSILTTNDNGYLISGVSNSNDGDFKDLNKGNLDIILFKIDSLGNIQWSKSIGGKESEECSSVVSSNDGGFVMTGYTCSNDYDFRQMNKGGCDIFILKVDNLGNIIWKKTLGGTREEHSTSITSNSYGQFIITGTSRSKDGEFKGLEDIDYFDFFVILVDSMGELVWTKIYGNGYWGGWLSKDQGNNIIYDKNGNYLIVGETNSNDGIFAGMNKRGKREVTYDTFVIKLDSNGNLNNTTSINEFNETTTTLSIHPNPFSNSTTISYKVNIPSNVHIELLNTLGQTIEVLREDYSDIGTYQLALNVSTLSSGMYSVRMRSGSMNEVVPVCVVK
jgi:hypothetical protein